MKNIAILVSGSGTNAQNITEYFNGSTEVKIKSIITNNDKTTAIERMKPYAIECKYFPRAQWRGDTSQIISYLKDNSIDFIVLAGFLSIIDTSIIKLYPNRIVNLHPSLLPKYGGRGMYGMNVHNAIIEAGETKSGITIHYVNEVVDGGNAIAQFECPITAEDTPETLAEKIHKLEYTHYPIVIEKLITEISYI